MNKKLKELRNARRVAQTLADKSLTLLTWHVSCSPRNKNNSRLFEYRLIELKKAPGLTSVREAKEIVVEELKSYGATPLALSQYGASLGFNWCHVIPASSAPEGLFFSLTRGQSSANVLLIWKPLNGAAKPIVQPVARQICIWHGYSVYQSGPRQLVSVYRVYPTGTYEIISGSNN